MLTLKNIGALAICLASPRFSSADETLAPDLSPPVRITTLDGRPIDTGRIGHAAPAWGDIDADGRPDLLLGEYFEGRMRFYANVGAPGRPAFQRYEWFRAAGALGRVPEG